MSASARVSLKRLALAALTLAAGLAIGCSAGGGHPNVLVVVMDTTRADRCSVTGYERETTPRIAEFARDAAVFTDAWSPASWTGPAHASLFTGLRPEHHGFRDGNRYYLTPKCRTLAERFHEAGYATGCFTNNNWLAPEWGLVRGFDRVEPMYLRRDDLESTRAAATHALAADWAESESRAGRPFFLVVNDMEAHLPYSPPEAEALRFVRGDPSPDELAAARSFDFPQQFAFDLRVQEVSQRRLALMSDLYDAEIASLDHDIGTLLDRLRRDGLLDSTVVVILGDHGELLGDHHMIEHGHSLLRAARHVPLVVRFPGTFDGGRREHDAVRLEDIAPTLLELCRLDVPTDLDGASLARDLPGRVSIAIQGANPKARALIEQALPGVDAAPLTLGMQAVYDGRFHFLRWSDGRPPELYDDSGDPSERENLAPARAAEAERLARLLPPFE